MRIWIFNLNMGNIQCLSIQNFTELHVGQNEERWALHSDLWNSESIDIVYFPHSAWILIFSYSALKFTLSPSAFYKTECICRAKCSTISGYMTFSTEKCYIPKSAKSSNFAGFDEWSFGISRYKFRLNFWFNLNLYQVSWVSGFGGFWGGSIFSGIYHTLAF